MLCVAFAILSTTCADVNRQAYGNRRPFNQYYSPHRVPGSWRPYSVRPAQQNINTHRTVPHQDHTQAQQRPNADRTVLQGWLNNPPQQDQGQRRLGVPSRRPQNSRYFKSNNQQLVQPQPLQPFFRQGINPPRGQTTVLSRHNSNKHTNPSSYQRNSALNYRRLNIQQSPWQQNRLHHPIRPQSASLRSSSGQKYPTQDRIGGVAKIGVTSQIARAPSRSGKQWTLSRKLVANSPGNSWNPRPHSGNRGERDNTQYCIL